jgi:hypothetical protein
MVGHICNYKYLGVMNRKIIVQASLEKKVRSYLKTNLEGRKGRSHSSRGGVLPSKHKALILLKKKNT